MTTRCLAGFGWGVLLMSVVLAGCSSRQEPRRRAAAAPPSLCSLVDLRLAPLGVRVVNRSVDSVTIFTEVCRGHARVGDITAGSTRMFELPKDLVSRAGGVRLMIYRNGSLEGSSIEMLRLERRVFEVEIPKDPPAGCKRVVYVDGKKIAGDKPEVPRGRIIRVEVLLTEGLDPNCPPLNFITTNGG